MGPSVTPERCTSVSMSETTASASAMRPRISSHLGDSCSERRHHSKTTTGKDTRISESPSLWAQRNNEVADERRRDEAEREKPARAVKAPRYRLLTNSTKNGAMMAPSAPMPIPAMARSAAKARQSSTKAFAKVMTEKNVSVHIITTRRPNRSPSNPANNAPIRKPPRKCCCQADPSPDSSDSTSFVRPEV